MNASKHSVSGTRYVLQSLSNSIRLRPRLQKLLMFTAEFFPENSSKCRIFPKKAERKKKREKILLKIWEKKNLSTKKTNLASNEISSSDQGCVLLICWKKKKVTYWPFKKGLVWAKKKEKKLRKNKKQECKSYLRCFRFSL